MVPPDISPSLLCCCRPYVTLCLDLTLLKQAYQIEVEPYLDMQLADIHGRIQRREGPEEQIKRLSSVAFPEEEVRKLQIEGVHMMSKMDRALREHAVDAPMKESG